MQTLYNGIISVYIFTTVAHSSAVVGCCHFALTHTDIHPHTIYHIQELQMLGRLCLPKVIIIEKREKGEKLYTIVLSWITGGFAYPFLTINHYRQRGGCAYHASGVENILYPSSSTSWTWSIYITSIVNTFRKFHPESTKYQYQELKIEFFHALIFYRNILSLVIHMCIYLPQELLFLGFILTVREEAVPTTPSGFENILYPSSSSTWT